MSFLTSRSLRHPPPLLLFLEIRLMPRSPLHLPRPPLHPLLRRLLRIQPRLLLHWNHARSAFRAGSLILSAPPVLRILTPSRTMMMVLAALIATPHRPLLLLFKSITPLCLASLPLESRLPFLKLWLSLIRNRLWKRKSMLFFGTTHGTLFLVPLIVQ